jgi:hypothetical protein
LISTATGFSDPLCMKLRYPSGENRSPAGLRIPVPRQELVELCHRLIVDPAQFVGEPCLRIDIVEFGGDDQRVDGGGAFTAAV